MRALALAALLVAAGCAKKAPKFEPRPAGGPCEEHYECQSGLRCHDEVCTSEADIIAAQEKAARIKEQQMLERSGVSPASTPEAGEAASGARVRVVEITERGLALAACRSDERLIGGSCEGWNLKTDGPRLYSATDTVGARWVCEATESRQEVTAYALCAALQ